MTRRRKPDFVLPIHGEREVLEIYGWKLPERKPDVKEPWEKELDRHEGKLRTYTVTQEQMDRLHGAAHSGAMLGGDAAYQGCLKVEAILAEIAFKEGFDKSPGFAPED